MGGEPEKKNDQTFFSDIAKTVIAGIIMLVCTTLYNLVLAHIWPVMIHFGEYSFNNLIFILVSVVSSVLLVLLILALEIFYIFSSIASAILDLIPSKDKRPKRKTHWYEFILNTILLASLGLVNGIFWLISSNYRKEKHNEEAQEMIKNLPALKNEQKP